MEENKTKRSCKPQLVSCVPHPLCLFYSLHSKALVAASAIASVVAGPMTPLLATVYPAAARAFTATWGSAAAASALAAAWRAMLLNDNDFVFIVGVGLGV